MGHVDAARLLLDNGAEVDRATEDGTTPLFIAKSKGHSAVVALLDEFSFQKAATFTGPKPGYIFKTGAKGTGYYRDVKPTISPGTKLPPKDGGGFEESLCCEEWLIMRLVTGCVVS